MNFHKKLLKMGFKKTTYHIKQYDGKLDRYTMKSVSKIEETKRSLGEKFEIKTIYKLPPKWTYFYVLNFSENIKIWAQVEKHSDVLIYLESSQSKQGVEILYGKGWNNPNGINLNGANDIIKLFPKEIQRDFLLNSIFD